MKSQVKLFHTEKKEFLLMTYFCEIMPCRRFFKITDNCSLDQTVKCRNEILHQVLTRSWVRLMGEQTVKAEIHCKEPIVIKIQTATDLKAIQALLPSVRANLLLVF